MTRPLAVIEAILRLIAHDAYMLRHDLAALHDSVRKFPQRARNSDPEDVEIASHALDIACAWYPKRALCLQRSSVLVKMLRRRGEPARLVIGAQKLPFAAHAWVEVNGKIVNDRLASTEKFLILEIC
jgi:hypothetical protein